MRPAIFFPSVVAPVAPATRRLHRLAIQHRRGWPGGAVIEAPHFPPQSLVNPLPSAVGLPQPKIRVHRLPRREVMRQRSPRAASAQQVEHRIQQIAVTMPSRPASRLGSRNEVFDVVPLKIFQVCWVGLPCHDAQANRSPNIAKDGFLNTLLGLETTMFPIRAIPRRPAAPVQSAAEQSASA